MAPTPSSAPMCVGTHVLLEAARAYWMRLPTERATAFRFLHVSTDEVYGSLGPEGSFSEETAYDPSSPYAASKASADHLAGAWHRTFGLPVVISNCSNNYGPYHFPEKLIPLIILNALEEMPLPVYGDGSNVRDWLYVEDHARALCLILAEGRPGEKYNVGGRNERTNLAVVETICDMLDRLVSAGAPRRRLITLRTGSARPRPPLRHQPGKARARHWLARRARLRQRPRQDGALVSRQPGLVGAAAQGCLFRRAPGPDQGRRVGHPSSTSSRPACGDRRRRGGRYRPRPDSCRSAPRSAPAASCRGSRAGATGWP